MSVRQTSDGSALLTIHGTAEAVSLAEKLIRGPLIQNSEPPSYFQRLQDDEQFPPSTVSPTLSGSRGLFDSLIALDAAAGGEPRESATPASGSSALPQPLGAASQTWADVALEAGTRPGGVESRAGQRDPSEGRHRPRSPSEGRRGERSPSEGARGQRSPSKGRRDGRSPRESTRGRSPAERRRSQRSPSEGRRHERSKRDGRREPARTHDDAARRSPRRSSSGTPGDRERSSPSAAVTARFRIDHPRIQAVTGALIGKNGSNAKAINAICGVKLLVRAAVPFSRDTPLSASSPGPVPSTCAPACSDLPPAPNRRSKTRQAEMIPRSCGCQVRPGVSKKQLRWRWQR